MPQLNPCFLKLPLTTKSLRINFLTPQWISHFEDIYKLQIYFLTPINLQCTFKQILHLLGIGMILSRLSYTKKGCWVNYIVLDVVWVVSSHCKSSYKRTALNILQIMLLPPFQIISHSKNLGESKFFKFDQIYKTR